MSGVTLFSQRQLQYYIPEVTFKFDKAGYEDDNNHNTFFINNTSNNNDSAADANYHYIISEESNIDGYNVVAVQEGNPRISLKHMHIQTDDVIFLHELSSLSF